jgi:hypothetical protein
MWESRFTTSPAVFPLPTPTPLETVLHNPDYQDGNWMIFDVDVTRLDTKPVRLNISLASALMKMIDIYAADYYLTRSGFLASAAREAMQRKAAALQNKFPDDPFDIIPMLMNRARPFFRL